MKKDYMGRSYIGGAKGVGRDEISAVDCLCIQIGVRWDGLIVDTLRHVV